MSSRRYGNSCETGGVPTNDPLRPLLDAALEGDDVALGELVRRSQADVWRLCSMLGSGDEEDLVQETYLRALRSLDRYRGDAPVLPWLLAIARNVCADQVRTRQRQRRILRRVADQRPAGATTVGDATEALLAHLAPDRREAFVLTQVLGLTYDEAAVVAGCPVGTIRSRVARGRADLVELVRRSEAV